VDVDERSYVNIVNVSCQALFLGAIKVNSCERLSVQLSFEEMCGSLFVSYTAKYFVIVLFFNVTVLLVFLERYVNGDVCVSSTAYIY
jgi:hypothetical protein